MKYILITAIIVVSAFACNYGNHKTRTERMEDNNTKMVAEDDGTTLKIAFKTKNSSNPVDYNESFNVANMSDSQKQNLKKHILDSLSSIK